MIFKKALDAQQAHPTADKAPYFEMCCTRWVSKRPAESGPCPSRDLQARELLNGHEVYTIPYAPIPSAFDWRTPGFSHDHSVCSNHIGRNPKCWAGDKIMRQLQRFTYWSNHFVSCHVCISKAGMQRRRPKQVENSARLGGKPANLGFASLLRANFNKMCFLAEVVSMIAIFDHFCWLLGFCQFHLGTLNIVSGQVHKSLQTIRSHLSCCVRFRVSSFIRPSANELQERRVMSKCQCDFNLQHIATSQTIRDDIAKETAATTKRTTTPEISRARDHDHFRFSATWAGVNMWACSTSLWLSCWVCEELGFWGQTMSKTFIFASRYSWLFRRYEAYIWYIPSLNDLYLLYVYYQYIISYACNVIYKKWPRTEDMQRN